ncbi:hypothetical protein ABI59_14175 [Acidobacteria bacterium Mor1]|nr:hypothetical protein ABI59_14175 [Acidobacteria bacterium Mor1]
MNKEALQAAAGDNFVEHSGWAARRTWGMRVASTDDLTIVDSGQPNDAFNVVCRARVAPDKLSSRIELVKAYYAKEKQPFTWWIGPADTPAGLAEALTDAGFVEDERLVLMEYDPSGFQAADTLPDDYQVMHARGAEHIVNYSRTLGRLFEPPDVTFPRYYQAVTPALYKPECPVRLYVGYLDNEAVATAELTVTGKVGGLYNVATIPSVRKRGLSRALIGQALLDARELGLERVILQTGDAEPFFAKLGFKPFGEWVSYQLRG